MDEVVFCVDEVVAGAAVVVGINDVIVVDIPCESEDPEKMRALSPLLTPHINKKSLFWMSASAGLTEMT